MLSLATAAQAQEADTAGDKAALVALYDATSGSDWTANANWKSDEALSTWHGVTVNRQGRVTYLALANNKLAGMLPSELADLSSLVSVDLGGNVALTGSLPEDLLNLADLDTLKTRDTELCAPRSDAFRAWLLDVKFDGLVCPPDEQSVIDVAVFWTPAARAEAGGKAGIRASIDLWVAETNTAYRDSGANMRLRLAVASETDYEEDAGARDLIRFKDEDDGYMDEIHEARLNAAADLVVLVRDDLGGLASFILDPYNPVDRDVFALVGLKGGAVVFAHELGHLAGLSHDRYDNCRHGSCEHWRFNYSFGYVNQAAFEPDAPESARWRTIMSSWWECNDKLDFARCVWLLRWSNPSQTHEGGALGVAGLNRGYGTGPADATRALNRTRAIVAEHIEAPEITASFSAASYRAEEGGEAAEVTVQLTGAPSRRIALQISASGRQGADASDYSAPSSVVFQEDETEKTVRVVAVSDRADDDGESVTFSLATPLPAGVTAGSPAMATVTLVDDDLPNRSPSPVGSLADQLLRIGESPATVSLAGAFRDQDGDPLTYGATSSDAGVASVAIAGSAVRIRPVSVGSATVTATATDATGSNVPAEQRFTVEVLAKRDDPEVAASFGRSSYEVPEGGSVSVEVRLDRDPERTVTLPLESTPRGGVSPEDYSGLPFEVTFGPGERSVEFPFSATDDGEDDDGEAVELRFGSPLPPRVTAGAGTVLAINDNDDDNNDGGGGGGGPPAPPPPGEEEPDEPEDPGGGGFVPPRAAIETSAECRDGLCRALTGAPVRFADASTGSVERRFWDFGDGGSRASSLSRSWSSPGFYEVALLVSGGGRESSASLTFLVAPAEPAGTCAAGAGTLCLQDSRFSVEVEWWTASGERGAGRVVRRGSNDSGLFSFFGGDNWELLIKVLDGCSLNGHVWVYAALTTDLGYRIAVTDTVTGEVREYVNEPGRAAPAVADATAFAASCAPDSG